MLGGAARAVQAVQPATCLRCSRLRETHTRVPMCQDCVKSMYPSFHTSLITTVKNDRERFTGIKSVGRHPFHFLRCKVFGSEKFGNALFGNPNWRSFIAGERNRAQLRSDGWICSEIQAHV